MKIAQKIATSLLVVGMLLPLTAKADETTPTLVSSLDCVVTAYYQPLPNQQNYSKGNFEAEVALNGDDTTANGSKVSVGTVAAPPQYPFGTIVDIGGFDETLPNTTVNKITITKNVSNRMASRKKSCGQKA